MVAIWRVRSLTPATPPRGGPPVPLIGIDRGPGEEWVERGRGPPLPLPMDGGDAKPLRDKEGAAVSVKGEGEGEDKDEEAEGLLSESLAAMRSTCCAGSDMVGASELGAELMVLVLVLVLVLIVR